MKLAIVIGEIALLLLRFALSRNMPQEVAERLQSKANKLLDEKVEKAKDAAANADDSDAHFRD